MTKYDLHQTKMERITSIQFVFFTIIWKTQNSKSELKEFNKIKESMEPLLPLYRKYESTEGGLFQQYDNHVYRNMLEKTFDMTIINLQIHLQHNLGTR